MVMFKRLTDWFWCRDNTLSLPTPTQPAPPMTECKAPKQPDISEPVIKLLAMLDEDVWEVLYSWGEPTSFTQLSATHLVYVFNEDFKITLETYSSDYSTSSKRIFKGMSWVTEDEKEILIDKVGQRVSEINLLNETSSNKSARESYKRYLDTI